MSNAILPVYGPSPVVLERGKVVQRGNHDELRGVVGPYSRLIRAE